MQEKNEGTTITTMVWGRVKFLISILLTLGLLAACVSSPSTQRAPEAAREEPNQSPFKTANVGTPGAPREMPTLEDLFGRFQKDEIRIALLLPLSGPGEDAGQAFLDAASMALFESYDPRLQMFPLDTKGTPDGARAAAYDAIEREADIVLGPLFSSSIEAVKPILESRGIKAIGFSNNPKVAGGGVYLLSFLPEQEARRVITYAGHNGYNEFAALIPNTAYGEAVLAGFSGGVRATGGDIAALEIYERNSQTVFEPVKRLANYDERRQAYEDEERFLNGMKPDDLVDEIMKKMEAYETIGEVPFSAVLVPEGGQFLRSMIPLLPFYEVDPLQVKFLGTGLWHDPTLIGEPSLEGAWFAGADPAKVEDFMDRFQSFFGYRPPRIATLAYDGVGLVATLSRIEVRRNRFSDDTLRDPNGFSGIDGIFRFTRDGLNERGFAILEITEEGFQVVDKAPSSFAKK